MHKLNSNSKLECLLLTQTKEHTFTDPQYTSTPKPRRQLQFMSPYFHKSQKDLFSQLLGTQTKLRSPLSRSCAQPPPLSPQFQDQPSLSPQSQHLQIVQQHYSNSHCSSSLNKDDLRKRKRKSNHQLKLLKQQFEKDDGGWNKDRIVRMAEVTGLSESQVYKWCWDQKKKTATTTMTARHCEGYLQEEMEGEGEEDGEEGNGNGNGKGLGLGRTRPIKKTTRTKRKTTVFADDRSSFINKRLLFN